MKNTYSHKVKRDPLFEKAHKAHHLENTNLRLNMFRSTSWASSGVYGT